MRGASCDRPCAQHHWSDHRGSHLTPVRMAFTKETRDNRYWLVVEKGDLCARLVGMPTGAATVDISVERPQRTKKETSLESSYATPVNGPKERTATQRDLCAPRSQGHRSQQPRPGTAQVSTDGGDGGVGKGGWTHGGLSLMEMEEPRHLQPRGRARGAPGSVKYVGGRQVLHLVTCMWSLKALSSETEGAEWRLPGGGVGAVVQGYELPVRKRSSGALRCRETATDTTLRYTLEDWFSP